MFPLADRMSLIADSITLAVSAKAGAMKKAGIDVVGFGAGEPDFDTPAFIKEAAKAALDKGQTKYTPTPCFPELKAAIADKFVKENGLAYKPENITVGAGGKHCLYMAFMAVLNPGDEVLIPSPYWVSYPEQVKLAGGVPKIVRGEEANGFKITPQQFEAAITPKTRVFVINSPSNPAGHAYTAEELKALADVVAKHPQVVVFSDEIYEKLLYGGLKFASFATLNPVLFDRTLTFNCHSKSFAMTGWRVGYIGGPKFVIDAINKLQSQMNSHITSFTQIPAAIALTDPQAAVTVEQMRQEFEKRGQHMWKRLSELPKVTCVRPQGAFYCFPNVSAYFGKTAGTAKITDAVSFAAALLEQSHVAVVPGNDSGFETHVRLSFATSMAQIDKGLDRIAEFLKKLG
ncbi:pyridoxal phosphate-dependent aminotransferase [Humisphaera borealis]|uniref:Pyridoxal phosphate-dependent aminotransferase n=1 Tax=Humisphaera borealis TaxID=2807512 RepID=A0A7M2WYW0_9BACT|nr:pyridoxal phosphate-dependent aminotransferase [Humisphaera borealis]QOV90402.1 pyridoxal phosphate-dependent aminotransferase [Humisphaera borealis]